MKALHCQCGQAVFCDNTFCNNCGRALGFLTQTGEMLSLDQGMDRFGTDAHGKRYRFCSNRIEYGVCNGLVEAGQAGQLCFGCSLNRTIPDLSRPANIDRWRKLERAKRRFITGLASAGLGSIEGLTFDFMEDQRTHPFVQETFVNTGHSAGVITINVLEADEVQRTQQMAYSGERYRTLLGHFRHEVGHYYYSRLVRDIAPFASLFGDPTLDYDTSLGNYYSTGPSQEWQHHYISAYASSHPFEDWAECFAHYLHMRDSLETAVARELVDSTAVKGEFLDQLQSWADFSVSLNEMNEALGLRHAYPFTFTETVRAKLEYVHRQVDQARD